jgi:uncharacterized protein YqjF (DUF2071 family)
MMTITNPDHRPWPLPNRPWAMVMRWHDLLFMHWPLDLAVLRPLVPSSLQIDTYDGKAWIGIVPFRMTGVRPRFVPALPGLSSFAEINVRTYVTMGSKPGVWFFSLDAANRPAVWAARWTFHLPYYFARISVQEDRGGIVYQSVRQHGRSPEAQFAATYRPTRPVFQSTRGSIDYWLTERYCLYAADRMGRIFRGDIHHEPWPLQPAAATIRANTMTAPLAIDLPLVTPLVHFARRLDVVAWRLEHCS